jgi:hypothetical protein
MAAAGILGQRYKSLHGGAGSLSVYPDTSGDIEDGLCSSAYSLLNNLPIALIGERIAAR